MSSMTRIKIQVLEPELERCEAVVKETINALTGLPVVTELERIRDMEKIKKFNVTTTPALVINNKVRVIENEPQKEEIRKWLYEEYTPA